MVFVPGLSNWPSWAGAEANFPAVFKSDRRDKCGMRVNEENWTNNRTRIAQSGQCCMISTENGSCGGVTRDSSWLFFFFCSNLRLASNASNEVKPMCMLTNWYETQIYAIYQLRGHKLHFSPGLTTDINRVKHNRTQNRGTGANGDSGHVTKHLQYNTRDDWWRQIAHMFEERERERVEWELLENRLICVFRCTIMPKICQGWLALFPKHNIPLKHVRSGQIVIAWYLIV